MIYSDSDLYIVGGYEANETSFMQKIIKISLTKLSEDELSFKVFEFEDAPSPRANCSCCLVDNQIYLFGGGKVDEVYSDLWSWCI